MERGGTQGIQFIITIVLARLLLPADFGLIAIVTVFITLSNVFVQSGLNTALIQKKNVDEVDFSSVFYLSLFIAVLLFILLYFISPFISNYYHNTQLIPILRVLSITLFLGAFNSIQNAFIARNMIFKKLFFSSLGAILVSATAGISAGYLGFGVWALVVYQLTNQLAIIIILSFIVKWRPHLLFSFERVKVLFSFGWKLLASSLLNTLYAQIRTLIIGRIYNPAMLGFYDKGKQFPQIIVSNIDGSIQSVMLPALASQQENLKMVKGMMRRAIVTSSLIMFPIMVGLVVVAEPAVKTILTEKWLPAVPFIQIFCAAYALTPIHTANLQAINALGRSDIFFRLEIIKTGIGLTILGISIPFGIYVIAWGSVLSGVISSFINAYPNSKLIDYSYMEQWRDIVPPLLISLAMGGIVFLLNVFNISAWQLLIMQIVVGAVLYIGMVKIFKIESFSYLITTIREIIINKNRLKV
jgi:teichuronic acid exporter